MGQDCGSVGRAVASDTRSAQFESNHLQNLYWTIAYCQLNWKDTNLDQEAENDPSKKAIFKQKYTVKPLILVF